MERYFVKSREDAPEKGPYTLDAIKKSFENQMLKGEAIVRPESGGAAQSLRELLELPTPREAGRNALTSEYTQADMDAMVRRNKSAGSANMAVGAVMIIAGLGLTAATYSASSGGGRYVIFTGLIVFGFVRLIRGASGH